jgi:hypothetical protein
LAKKLKLNPAMKPRLMTKKTGNLMMTLMLTKMTISENSRGHIAETPREKAEEMWEKINAEI